MRNYFQKQVQFETTLESQFTYREKLFLLELFFSEKRKAADVSMLQKGCLAMAETYLHLNLRQWRRYHLTMATGQRALSIPGTH